MKIDFILSKIKADLKAYALTKLAPKLDSLADYWKHLSEREQWLIKIGGILIAIAFAFFVIGMAMDLQSHLENDISTTELSLASTKSIAFQLKDLSQISANDYTTISADKVKGDITQLFGIKNPDVASADKAITVQIPDAKFELVMLFLDQLRKSYGVFPSHLKITRSSQPGFVSFNATFNVEE